jgi:hypothetical protein
MHNKENKPKLEEIKTNHPIPNQEKLEEFDCFQNNTSLQSHFKKFRKTKKEDIKSIKKARAMQINKKDQAFKDNLRSKFLETALKYFGTPYGAKFWEKGEKHYNAPLYLDCCALVAQIVYDLKDDFGFLLDRGNQAFQFDTLPIDLQFSELKPGDLIFYSGLYFDETRNR